MKQVLSRTEASLEEANQSSDSRHLLSRLQIDYEKCKTDLSKAHDEIVQHEIENQILKQHSTDKTNEVLIEVLSSFELLFQLFVFSYQQ